MTKLEIAAVVLSPFTLLGLMTALGAFLASLHKRKVRKLETHPLSQRRANASAQVLLDEPPAECPECKTPLVAVSRADFTPQGSKVALPQTEHFVCEHGHRWFGPNQEAVLAKRVEARRHLRPVKAEAPKPEERLASKLAELTDACEASTKDDDCIDSRDHD